MLKFETCVLNADGIKCIDELGTVSCGPKHPKTHKIPMKTDRNVGLRNLSGKAVITLGTQSIPATYKVVACGGWYQVHVVGASKLTAGAFTLDDSKIELKHDVEGTEEVIAVSNATEHFVKFKVDGDSKVYNIKPGDYQLNARINLLSIGTESQAKAPDTYFQLCEKNMYLVPEGELISSMSDIEIESASQV